MADIKLTFTPLPIEKEGVRVIKLAGTLTLPSVFDFQDAMREEKSPVVILDFTEVLYVDSAGIGAVVRAHVSRSNEKGGLLLVGLASRVQTMLEVTGLTGVLKVYPTLKDAQEGL
jgi:anti-sigma B factor antagonist